MAQILAAQGNEQVRCVAQATSEWSRKPIHAARSVTQWVVTLSHVAHIKLWY